MGYKVYIKEEINLNNISYKSKLLNYSISNESLFNISEGLEKIYGLDKYVGICGGGTQNLYILSKLCKNNNLKEIILIDKNKLQLDNFKQIIGIYNNSSKKRYEDELIKLIKKRTDERIKFYIIRHRFDKEEYKLTNLTKQSFNKNLKITLVIGDIFDFLSKINYKGKYFFYLSNVLNYKKIIPDFGIRNARLRQALQNKKIQSDSLLLLIKNIFLFGSTKAVITKKSRYLKDKQSAFFTRLFNLLSMLKP